MIISRDGQIEELKNKLKEIEAMLKQFDNPNTPSSQQRFKKNKEKKDKKERFPGKPKGSNGGGIKLPKPDREQKHTIDQEGYVMIGQRIKTVIDFIDKPIEVIKHIIYKYRAPDGSIVWADADLPKGIYGKNLQALVTLMKGKFGSSNDNIAELINSIRDDLSFSTTTNFNLINNMSTALASERKKIMEHIRMSFYNNADETGLRQDGLNGYVWVFATPSHVLFETDLSRSGEVPERILGADYDGFVVRDGWSGYNKYKGQRCWPHLTRELDALAEDSKEISVQAEYFNNLYKRCKETKTKPPNERMDFVQKASGKMEIGYMINALSKINGCKEFTTKVKNAMPYLFTGVIHPEIPLDNNYAERKLRRIVVHRKIMGGIRNEKGETFIENAMSAMETWKQQGKNIFENLKKFAS